MKSSKQRWNGLDRKAIRKEGMKPLPLMNTPRCHACKHPLTEDPLIHGYFLYCEDCGDKLCQT